ncbi:MAG: hypothetical protein KGZ67_05015 [Hydrogenophaga sp.]|jgi:hypothetical protein|nr:hypothetical protein [Hydrogenophaga sp.]
MGFDRNLLPDPATFYEEAGLRLTGRGKWRTVACEFHGGGDSMRVNTASGAFVCMAGCGARGGDVLAYHMARTGAEFVEAARALGAWVDDGTKPAPSKPTPLSPRAALAVLAHESFVVAVAAGNVAHGVMLSDRDRGRVLQAASRINRLAEVFA